MELARRSSGVAKAGLATGITGTALGGLNTLTLLGMGANALGGFGRGSQPVVVTDNGGYPVGGRCSEDHYVNRYELEPQQHLRTRSIRSLRITIVAAETKERGLSYGRSVL